MPVADQPGGTGFVAVAAISNKNAWAVGAPLAWHWDGTTWTVVPSQSPGTAANSLNYVAVTPTGNAWAVGSYYDDPVQLDFRTLVERPVYNCGGK